MSPSEAKRENPTLITLLSLQPSFASPTPTNLPTSSTNSYQSQPSHPPPTFRNCTKTTAIQAPRLRSITPQNLCFLHFLAHVPPKKLPQPSSLPPPPPLCSPKPTQSIASPPKLAPNSLPPTPLPMSAPLDFVVGSVVASAPSPTPNLPSLSTLTDTYHSLIANNAPLWKIVELAAFSQVNVKRNSTAKMILGIASAICATANYFEEEGRSNTFPTVFVEEGGERKWKRLGLSSVSPSKILRDHFTTHYHPISSTYLTVHTHPYRQGRIPRRQRRRLHPSNLWRKGGRQGHLCPRHVRPVREALRSLPR